MKRIILVVLLLLVANLTACDSNTTESNQMVVENVQANMALPSDTGSVWLKITNNTGTDDALTGASLAGCGAIELHDMFMENDVMVMRKVEGDQIPIPAGETVELKQGGLHIMCIGKEAPLELGSSVEITLQFANADPIVVTGTVVEPAMNMENDANEMDMGE
jgi:copper(I)-binding protein